MIINGNSAFIGVTPAHPLELAGLLEQSFAAELDAIRSEAIGWMPLDHGVYLHEGVSSKTDDDCVIQVVGLPDFQMAAMNLLLLV